MSTSNFWGGVRPFGIVASDCSTFYRWYCPSEDCEGVELERDGNGGFYCPRCGCSTSSPLDDACETDYELSGEGECMLQDLREDLQELTDSSLFYNFELKGGYYEGLEVVATYKDGGAHEGYCGGVCYGTNPLTLDGCYYDLCTGGFNYEYTNTKRLKRDFAVDTMNCLHELEKIADFYDFYPLEVAARFSNGETWYTYKREGVSRA